MDAEENSSNFKFCNSCLAAKRARKSHVAILVTKTKGVHVYCGDQKNLRNLKFSLNETNFVAVC
jgi:hypothetical protein